ATYARAGFEILGARTIAKGSLPPPAGKAKGETLRKSGSRHVVFDDPTRPVATAIYPTTFPPPCTRVTCPAIIGFPGQGGAVPPPGIAQADKLGNPHVSVAR